MVVTSQPTANMADRNWTFLVQRYVIVVTGQLFVAVYFIDIIMFLITLIIIIFMNEWLS